MGILEGVSDRADPARGPWEHTEMLMVDCTGEVRAYAEQAASEARLLQAKLALSAGDPGSAVRDSAMEILGL